MIKRRRRFKQTVPLKDRLCAFAKDLREEASRLPAGPERDAMLERASRADTAVHVEDWARSAGLQPPT
jgi:hypothetical protein